MLYGRTALVINVAVIGFLLEGIKVSLTLMKQMNLLHHNWFVAKTNWEEARDEMDTMMSLHLSGKGPSPTALMSANLSDLLFLMQDAWLELTDFMKLHAGHDDEDPPVN